MITLVRCAVVALLLVPGIGGAQDIDAGLAAYSSGNFELALRELKPRAEQGDATAQYYLGLMYRGGDGVVQSDAEAAEWFQLAADQGNADAHLFCCGLCQAKGNVGTRVRCRRD